MSSVATSSPDIAAIVTNLGVFSLAVAATVGGIWKAIKNIKSDDKTPPPSTIAGAVLVETTSMLMWSESNRDVCEALGNVRHELSELSHQIERLRDRIGG